MFVLRFHLLSHIGCDSYPMYVGSAGAAFLPLMFADRIVLPPELSPDVSEKVVFMPETFYFNSHPTSFPLFTDTSSLPSQRSRWNLPASGVVLLNHNQFYKFDRFSFFTMSDTSLSVYSRREMCNSIELNRCISAAISFEGGAGRGTLWLKSETVSVHNRLSSVTCTVAFLLRLAV